MTIVSTEAFELFYSYAHNDEKLRNELDKHLFNFKRQGLIVDWHDRNINAGTEWEHEIDTHLNMAHIILLLISPDFLASDYCYSIEMKRALERHEVGEARVIPIILQPVYWQGAPFSKLQMLPTNAKAVTRWRNRNDAFVDIAKGLHQVLKELRTTSSVKTAPSPSPLKAVIAFTTDPNASSLALEDRQVQEVNMAPVWNVPYRQSPFFTDREEILQRLRETFTKDTGTSVQRPLILSGLGGMGKTQIAIEYANRYRENYHVVLWAKANSQKVITSEFAGFTGLLNLPGKREQDQQYAIDAIKRWLEVHGNWLLILDNAEDLKMVYEYLPIAPKGHILLTARTQVTGGIAQRLDIEKLVPEDGALLLLRRAELLTAHGFLEDAAEQIRMQATIIAEALGGLPLAIDQAGAYIEETGASLQQYLELYASRRAELLKVRGGLLPDHPESVTASLSLSFEKVEQANPAAAELLRFLAFLYPDTIPHELIERGASEFGPPLEAMATEPLELNQVIGELRKYSLVRRNPDGATLNIHRLVQAVLKDDMDEPTQRQWAERAVRTVNRAFPQVEFAHWQACQQYLPQAQICSALIETWHFTFPEAARLLHEAGRYLLERGQYSEAASLIAQAMVIREQTLGSEHPDTAMSLNELAELYHEQGRYTEAEPLFKRALTIREHALGPNHPSTAMGLNNLAALYEDESLYTQAEPLFKRALAISEQALGPNHPDTAMGLNNLASLYIYKHLYVWAEPLLQRALAISERVLGSEHPNTLKILQNYILLLRSTNRRGRAVGMAARVKTLQAKHLQENWEPDEERDTM